MEIIEERPSEQTTDLLASDPIWRQLYTSKDLKEFTELWLTIQAAYLDQQVNQAVVVAASGASQFEPVAVWPKTTSVRPALLSVLQDFVKQRKDAPEKLEIEDETILVCPIKDRDRLCGVVAFSASSTSETDADALLDRLVWGSAQLEKFIHESAFSGGERLSLVLELLATTLYHDSFQESATALATEFANALGCERVAIGFLKGKSVKLRALSHSATFNKKVNLVRTFEAAMDEALDQHATIAISASEAPQNLVSNAHKVLIEQNDGHHFCTVPLVQGSTQVGAILFERAKEKPFEPVTIQLCEHAATLIGPVLDVKAKDDRWLGAKVKDSFWWLMTSLVGKGHTGLKLTALGCVALVLFFSFAKADYRVTADARLEGTVQRALAAPISGYVTEASVRAGDIVEQGDLLFSLDDKDLRLERLKWVSQKLKSTREFNEATALRDRARASVLAAQIEQAEAEIALLDEQLNRTKIRAPFDGFIVSGDLSQSLGAPVERGDVLFKLAPLDSYRVILEVDERDITQIVAGQQGRVVLSSAPDDKLDIAIQRITPIATPEEGKNYFRVEAIIANDFPATLRPGMEGVGKIEIEERKVFWIWTHKITHWMRMFVWSWWP